MQLLLSVARHASEEKNKSKASKPKVATSFAFVFLSPPAKRLIGLCPLAFFP
jgi:hypothetical protein